MPRGNSLHFASQLYVNLENQVPKLACAGVTSTVRYSTAKRSLDLSRTTRQIIRSGNRLGHNRGKNGCNRLSEKPRSNFRFSVIFWLFITGLRSIIIWARGNSRAENDCNRLIEKPKTEPIRFPVFGIFPVIIEHSMPTITFENRIYSIPIPNTPWYFDDRLQLD